MVGNPMKTPPRPNVADHRAFLPKAATRTPRRLIPHGCLPWGFAGFVVAVFLEFLYSLNPGPRIGIRGSQTKALAQAKQIGLALKLFANDHDGNYPRQEIPPEMKDAPTNSNQAFACLFPNYVQSEAIFGNKLSAYSNGRSPDNRIDNPYTGHPVETLRPGENVYGYMLGLTDSSKPQTPVVMDGTDGTGHYVSDRRARGGVWGGTKAVVVYLDNSAALENLTGPEKARYLPAEDKAQNLLDPTRWGKDVRYLDPAVAHP